MNFYGNILKSVLEIILRFYLSKAGEMLVVHEFRVTGSRIQGGILAYFGRFGADFGLFGADLGLFLACLDPIWAQFGLFGALWPIRGVAINFGLFLTDLVYMGPIWAYFGLFGVNLGLCWSIWDRLGPILAYFWPI